jgi:hypothetical protein
MCEKWLGLSRGWFFMKTNLLEIIREMRKLEEISPYYDSDTILMPTEEFDRFTAKVEAFEKELREKLAYVRSFQKTCVKKDEPMFAWEESVYRELLGEE